jgi:hypothetical protein
MEAELYYDYSYVSLKVHVDYDHWFRKCDGIRREGKGTPCSQRACKLSISRVLWKIAT